MCQVAKHLTKLFDSMAKLRFRQENDQDTKIALYMSSKDGEEVKLSSPCDCDGQVTTHSWSVSGQSVVSLVSQWSVWSVRVTVTNR